MAYQTKLELSADRTITLGGTGENGKPNPTSIEGYYLGSRATPDKGYGPGTLHFFQTAEGNVGVWGKSRLNNLLTADLRGQMVLATFTGMSKAQKGRRPAYTYKVQHDPAETIDVSGIDLNQVQEDVAGDAEPDYGDDVDTNDDTTAVDEVTPPRAQAPARPAQAPDAARQAKVQALLAKGRKTA